MLTLANSDNVLSRQLESRVARDGISELVPKNISQIFSGLNFILWRLIGREKNSYGIWRLNRKAHLRFSWSEIYSSCDYININITYFSTEKMTYKWMLLTWEWFFADSLATWEDWSRLKPWVAYTKNDMVLFPLGVKEEWYLVNKQTKQK